MSDKEIQTKLNQLVKLANALDDEAKRRYGSTGTLFFEADGGFHLMSGDSDGGVAERQKFIEFSSDGYCRMGGGAW
jgi:hypothetical protein